MTQFSASGVAVGGFIEFFAGQSTNASGLVALTLARTPAADTSVFIVCNNIRREASFVSRAGQNVTVVVHKLQYERATVGDTSAQNPPSGVALRTTSGGATVAPAAGTNAASVDAIGGSGNANNRASFDAHTHQFNHLYQHGHVVTQTFTDAPVAASESGLNFVVVYR